LALAPAAAAGVSLIAARRADSSQPWLQHFVDGGAASGLFDSTEHSVRVDDDERWRLLELQSLDEIGVPGDVDTHDRERVVVLAPLEDLCEVSLDLARASVGGLEQPVVVVVEGRFEAGFRSSRSRARERELIHALPATRGLPLSVAQTA